MFNSPSGRSLVMKGEEFCRQQDFEMYQKGFISKETYWERRGIKKKISRVPKNVFKIFCYLGIHKWETHENSGWYGHHDDPLEIQHGHIICKRCKQHLANYVTGIKISQNNPRIFNNVGKGTI